MIHVNKAAINYSALPAANTVSGDMYKVVSSSQGGTAQVYWVRSDGTNWCVLGGGPIFRGTWANKPTATDCPVWSTIAITDVGNALFITNGTAWKPMNGHALVFNTATVSFTDSIGTTETIAVQKQFPAALFAVSSMFSIFYTTVKATTQTVTGRLRLGTAGTTADTQIALWQFAASNQQYARTERYKFASATSLNRLGAGNSGRDDTYAGGQNTSFSPVTISNVSNSLYLTMTLAFDLAPTVGDTLGCTEMAIALIDTI